MALVFLPEPHEYHLDGRPVPSVTQVLNEWVKVDLGAFSFYMNTRTGQRVDAEVWEAAQDRGHAVHKMLELSLLKNGVSRSSLAAPLVPYLDGIEAWIDRYKPRVVLAEKPLADPFGRYAGTPDVFAVCKGIKHAVLLDGKSGMRGQVAAQTAGYEPLVRVATKYRGVIDRYVLDLKPEGFRFEPCAVKGDFQYFTCKLHAYQFERRMGL